MPGIVHSLCKPTESSRYSLLSVLTSVSTQITGGLDHWLTWPCWTSVGRELKWFFWSPRTRFKMKLDAKDPTINRDKSNQEALE